MFFTQAIQCDTLVTMLQQKKNGGTAKKGFFIKRLIQRRYGGSTATKECTQVYKCTNSEKKRYIEERGRKKRDEGRKVFFFMV